MTDAGGPPEPFSPNTRRRWGLFIGILAAILTAAGFAAEFSKLPWLAIVLGSTAIALLLGAVIFPEATLFVVDVVTFARFRKRLRALDGLPALRGEVDAIRKGVDQLLHISESILFGRVAGLDSETYGGARYHILFSHKDEDEDEHDHEYEPGEGERYRTAGFPFDETETILWLASQLARNLRLTREQLRPTCSCIPTESRKSTEAIRKRIAEGPQAIIGSPKSNKVCRRFMRDFAVRIQNAEITTDGPRYVMAVEDGDEDDPNRLAYMSLGDRDNGKNKWPDPIDDDDPEIENTILTDYAMFMRAPNPVPSDDNNDVLILAGCKVGGQCGLIDWLSSRKNLIYLDQRYAGKYFYVIIEVKYKYRPRALPRVVSVSDPIAEGRLEFGKA